MQVEKLLITVEEKTTYTFEVSPEVGFDNFPDDVEGLLEYAEEIKTRPTTFCDITNVDDRELLVGDVEKTAKVVKIV